MDERRRSFLKTTGMAAVAASAPATAEASTLRSLVPDDIRERLEAMRAKHGTRHAIVMIYSDDECGPLAWGVDLSNPDFSSSEFLIRKTLEEIAHWVNEGPCDDERCYACGRREDIMRGEP